MARSIAMYQDQVWRAVLTITYESQGTMTFYEGPYDAPGKAKARVTLHRNGRKHPNEVSRDGWIETAKTEWKSVEPDTK